MHEGTVSFSAEERSDGLHIEGVVTVGSGKHIPFKGWLALLAALEDVATNGDKGSTARSPIADGSP